jgi:PAS domain S-box-containing protein
VALRLSLLVSFILAACFPSAEATAQRKTEVLILAPGDSQMPATRALSDGVIGELKAGLGERVEILVEFLDTYTFPEPEVREATATLLQMKYGARHFDLVFALGPPAYGFIAERREAPYLDAPVVYLAMREASLESHPKLPNSTGILSKFDLRETVRLARLLQPDLRNLYVVSGSSEFDRSWESTARRELADYPGPTEISYLAGMRLDELLARLGTLPARSALLYLSMFEDAAGTTFAAPDIAARLAAAAPVYSVYSTYLDRGIVGGYMDTFEAVGKAGARLGLRILKGENAESIAPAPIDPQTYVVNWDAVQRWGLEPANLPPQAIIRNRQQSIWDQYREQILVFVILLVLQSVLIAALWTQGRRTHRAEVRLEESEDRMRHAASAANLGLWRWDSNTNQVWMTDHCRLMLGLQDRDEVSIAELLAVVHRDDRRPLQKQIERAARWHTPFEAEYRIVLVDASVRWLSVKGQSTRGAAGANGQVTGVVIDVSERKHEQIEAEQQRSQLTHLTRVAILGELSGAMAHELNQPLAAILSNAQAGQRLLERDPPDVEETRAIMDDIVADDLRAGEVIRRLRSLLKRGEARQERLQVSEVIAEVLDLAHSELVTQQISLEAELDRGLPPVIGDRVQLQQVLLNLVINACEAMRDISPLERLLSVRCQGLGAGGVEIVIADSGPGVSSEMLGQLFEPFSTTKKEGLGLGLSISRAIVAAHDGQLRVRNGDQAGAVFSIHLPAAN